MRRLVCYLVLLFMALTTQSTAHATRGLFPSGDVLFGVIMPDIRFAVETEPSSVEHLDEGDLISYQSFTPEDYDACRNYLFDEGISVHSLEINDGVMVTELEKNGEIIKLCYDHNLSTFSILYPTTVRREKEKYSMNAEKGNSILPDYKHAFGDRIPDFMPLLVGHPKYEISTEDEKDTIHYSKITVQDYSIINTQLTTNGYNVDNWYVEGSEMTATIGNFLFKYDIADETIDIICPTLYYLEECNAAQNEGIEALILPGISEAFTVLLPRISTITLHKPDQINETLDGGMVEMYMGFSEDDYKAFSEYLQKKGCSVDGYNLENTGDLVISLDCCGSKFTFSYNRLSKIATVSYPKGSVLEPEIR